MLLPAPGKDAKCSRKGAWYRKEWNIDSDAGKRRVREVENSWRFLGRVVWGQEPPRVQMELSSGKGSAELC